MNPTPSAPPFTFNGPPPSDPPKYQKYDPNPNVKPTQNNQSGHNIQKSVAHVSTDGAFEMEMKTQQKSHYTMKMNGTIVNVQQNKGFTFSAQANGNNIKTNFSYTYQP